MLTQTLITFLNNLGPVLCVAICSILPALETKIAIPLGMDYSVFGENSLSLFQSFLIATISSSLMSIVLIVIFHFLFNKKRKSNNLQTKFQNMLQKPLSKLQNLSKPKKIFMCLLFVFLPVPFSGIYGGAILCSLLKLSIPASITSLVLGNILSCGVEALMCLMLKPFISLFLNILIIIVILGVLYQLISFIFEKLLKNRAKNIK